jgi:hypothetical protein
MFASAGIKCPQIQLGAENNIEKSRCLAQMRKKIFAPSRARCWFFRLPALLEPSAVRGERPRSL